MLRKSGFLITPEYGLAGIIAMTEQFGFRIVHLCPDSTELAADILVAFAVLIFTGVLSVEHLGHIQTIQPHLVGVNGLVPEIALMGTGLTEQLAIEGINGLAVLFLAALGVDIKKNTALADVVQIIVLFLEAADAAVSKT